MKNTFFKRILSLILVLVVTLAALPFSSLTIYAAEETSGSCGTSATWSYDTDSAKLTISGSGDVTSTPWTRYYTQKIKTVVIENGITSLPQRAFENCSAIETVTMGNDLVTIGNYAFNKCSSLKTVNFGSKVATIGNYAFSYCASLTEIDIPNSVTSLGNSAFSYCANLAIAVIGEGITTVNSYTFQNCGLVSVTLGKNITKISNGAFGTSGAKKLVEIVNNSSLTLTQGAMTNGYVARYALCRPWRAQPR